LTAQTDARGVKTVMGYDRARRLTERRIALPVVANPVLAANTWEVAVAGCCMVWQPEIGDPSPGQFRRS
jgi:hypothetical protein